MADIDNLKEIDHAHTHLAGDTVLREAARRIRNSIRIFDTMGRYGGGQFVIVSPECDRTGAVSQAHRVRLQICEETIKTFKGEVAVTISSGIATASENHQARDLISSVDTALAEAKKAGRNRAEFVLN